MEVTMKLSIIRRKAVIQRLEDQLISGIKPRKNGKSWKDYSDGSLKMVDNKPEGVLLDKNDISRINKELETLKTRV